VEKTISVKLVKPLEYKGTPCKEGTVIAVSAQRANRLISRGLAVKDTGATAGASKSEQVKQEK